MKVKIFKIRIDEQFIHSDQKLLDNFLDSNNILKFESAFVKNEEYWSTRSALSREIYF